MAFSLNVFHIESKIRQFPAECNIMTPLVLVDFMELPVTSEKILGASEEKGERKHIIKLEVLWMTLSNQHFSQIFTHTCHPWYISK
jgi:hypothetical protein